MQNAYKLQQIQTATACKHLQCLDMPMGAKIVHNDRAHEHHVMLVVLVMGCLQGRTCCICSRHERATMCLGSHYMATVRSTEKKQK